MLVVPPIVLVPVTEPVPALMFQAVVTAAVGWFTVKLPPTEKLAFPVWVRELAVPLAVNTRLLQLLVVPVFNE